MPRDRSTTSRHVATKRGRLHQHPRDAGHEAVGQALLISIGLAGMLAAGRLAEISLAGLSTVVDALH